MRHLRWGWILLGALVLELVLFLEAIPLYLLFGQDSLLYVTPPSCLFIALALGYWIGGKAGRRQMLHGALMGALGALLFVLPNLAWGQPEPLAYDIAHGLKVVGGMVGGWLAARYSGTKPADDRP